MSDQGQTETAAMEAWKSRGRELNALYDAIAQTVRAFGMQPTPNDPLADLARLEALVERDELRKYVARLEGAIRHTVHRSRISRRTRQRLRAAMRSGGLL